MSLRRKIFLSFVFVVLILGAVATWIGIDLIGSGIVREGQKRAGLDLNTATEIYGRELNEINLLISLTADRFFIKDDLSNGRFQEIAHKLKAVKGKQDLDVLTLTDEKGRVIVTTADREARGESRAKDELVAYVLRERRDIASTQIMTRDELLKEGVDLSEMKEAVGIDASGRWIDDSGMVIKAASPVLDRSGVMIGILYGGKLLNGNYEIVDKVAGLVFKGETYQGKDFGAATVFQGDIRISTTLKGKNGRRDVGSRVSEAVGAEVLGKGRSWIARALVVDDWYLCAYVPIKNIKNEVIGILGVGILEQKYLDFKRRTLLIFSSITMAGLLGSLIIAYFLSNSITKPVESLVGASKRLAEGDLDFRVRIDSKDELGELERSFNSMALSIKERDRQLKEKTQEEVGRADRLAMIGRLSAGVAHEINNPLGSILLFSRLLIQKAPPEGIIRENLERIEKDAKRCQEIVQGLLDFARQREPKVEKIDVNALLENTVRLFENQPLFHNIELIKEYQTGLPAVMADSSQLMQVFVNIIMNATDAMKGDGVLTVGTRYFESDRQVRISFADTGCGIPEEKLELIFEPFYTTKEVGKGTGLGLSISFGIVQKHGGTIQVHSRVGEGSTFVVVLPVGGEGG